jgi:acetyl-CoA carboxylase biotin carboxyl carrier protein
MSQILFDPETIRKLAAILEERGLTELELQDGETSLRLARGAVVAAPVSHAVASVAAPLAAAAPVPVATGAAAPAGEAPPPAGAVPSPMVGIAYLSAEPGAPQFVAVGQAVTAGQTVMLIEAMKTFNQIKAPQAGTVTQILVASGQPVEYGQPLMVIA